MEPKQQKRAPPAGGHSYLFLDDLYRIRIADQPRGIDYFRSVANPARVPADIFPLSLADVDNELRSICDTFQHCCTFRRTLVADAVKVFLLTVSALFPIVDPPAGGPIFLAMAQQYPAGTRRALAWRVTLNSLLLMGCFA